MSLGGIDHTVHIVPEESVLLDVRTKFPCTVKGCDRTLTSYGALRMHRVKTHKLYQNEADLALAQKLKLKNCPKCVYHCPVANCHKSLRQGEKTSFFTSMKLLKQHYGKLHAEKKFVCEKCSRGFGLERDKRRHEQTCGFILRCKSCDCPYSTAEAMITHCRRKDHTPPDECLPKAKQKNGMKTKEAAQAYPQALAQNIFVFNVLPSPNSTLNLSTEATEGFRQILPKPIIQRTVSLPTVTTAGKTELTDVEGLAAKHSVDTQTVVRQVEQGTSVNSDLFTQAGISTGVQTTEGHGNRVDSRVSGNLETRGNQHVFSCMARRVYDLSYFNEISSTINQRDGGLEKVGISPRSSLLSSKNTGKVKVNSSTQHELAADMLGKDSADPFNMSDSISSTKGMQTLMSLPLKSQLSLAVAETQTPGDYILKQAMASANLSLGKVSKGSQVSPRSKGRGQKKVVPVNSQSCQTARLTEHKSTRRKKHRKSVSSVNKDSTGNNSKHRNNHRRVNTSVSCGFSSACICCVNSHPNRNYSEVFLHSAGKVTGGRSSCGEFPHTVTQSSHCDKVRSRVDCQCNSLKHSVQTQGNSTLQGSESMLPDGPHDDGGIQASLAEFDDFTDNQTQTIGILEELNSLAATISTQTADSYLTQPTETTTTTTHNVGSEQASQTQHNHTQTFMSAFTPLNMPLSGNHDEHYGDVFPTRSVLYSQAAPVSASLPSRCDKTKDLPNSLNSHGLSQPTPSSQVQSSGESSLTLPVDKTLSYVDSMCGSEAAELCNNSTAYSRDGYCVGGSLGASNKVTIAHADAQTTATDLLNLLDTGIQADSGPGTTIQTQTDVDEMWQLFCHNMETQTVDTDLLLQDLGFSDIQIQTNLDLEYLDDNSSTVETQTMWHSMSAASGGNVPQSDMQTQTRFSSSTFDPSLTDSHTQTPWEDLTSLLLQDL